eukprot:CAMPEP_0180798536 /NCGR_PEP_ID=MMETSP1038_2-20121128/58014_1 /TAXON_ID=632150 /ORGANISM="Azadinium spinosum, Strain 3D9" /LENGTH=57 /DNA_ID=CAMNT_0022837987 /DNA_START=24 /DNA_END=194 /DNA_ORIENTATION=-
MRSSHWFRKTTPSRPWRPFLSKYSATSMFDMPVINAPTSMRARYFGRPPLSTVASAT